MLYIYLAMLILSIMSMIYVGLHNFRNIEPFFWAISMVIPASILGYILTMVATTPEGIVLANDVAFIDDTLLFSLIFSGIMKEMKVKVPNVAKAFIYVFNFSIYVISVLPATKRWYYADITYSTGNWGNIVYVKAGPLMIVHGLFLVVLVLALFIARFDVEFRKRKTINKVVRSYFLIVEIASAINIIQSFMDIKYNLLPIIYALGLTYLSFNYRDKFVHDIDAIVANVYEKRKDCGYVAFDTAHRLVSYNDYIVRLLPEVDSITIDTVITAENERLYNIFENGQRRLREGNGEPQLTDIGGRLYKITATYFYVAKDGATAGTVFKVEDYTEQHLQNEFVTRYDDNMHNEVDKQLRIVKKKYHKMEKCLADFIENRDSVTGGHVKRTSDTMQIVVNTMAEHKIANITYDLAEDMSRAAVLHDIGKIAINDSILCKPQNLTDEEYESVKTHTTKGAEIISKMYSGNEEAKLADVAINVAKYHHERYDGTGYPEGLKGEEIPLEARIMALVDAYDAMVTERSYKEKMTFKEAEKEIMACMGSQFDPMLKKVFSLCRSQLEKYYTEADA